MAHSAVEGGDRVVDRPRETKAVQVAVIDGHSPHGERIGERADRVAERLFL